MGELLPNEYLYNNVNAVDALCKDLLINELRNQNEEVRQQNEYIFTEMEHVMNRNRVLYDMIKQMTAQYISMQNNMWMMNERISDLEIKLSRVIEAENFFS